MKWAFIFLLLVCFVALASSSRRREARPVEVQFTNLSSSDEFSVLVNGAVWFQSGSVFVRGKGRTFTTDDGSLSYLAGQTVRSKGSDNLGSFQRTTLAYGSASLSGTEPVMKASISVYRHAVIFEQVFPKDIAGTSTGDADSLVSAFPTFVVSDPSSPSDPSGYAHWVSWWYGATPQIVSPPPPNATGLPSPGFLTPSYGQWNASLLLPGGLGGTGVTCVFDRAGSSAAVLSPLANPMAVSSRGGASQPAGAVQFGVMGNVTVLPRGTAFSTLLVVGSGSGSGSVNRAVREWGAAVRRWHGRAVKEGDPRARDVTLQYLGYTTDNGAYYYYNTAAGTDYQGTMLGVHAYSQAEALPYRYVLLDSWFYYRGANGGVLNWTARPDVFPDGLDHLYRRTGWLVQAHNRYWAYDNVYARQNGGDWDFLLDGRTDGAVPLGQGFWDAFLSAPKSAWGLRVYEQDWLFNEYAQYVGAMLEDASLARRWLLQMGRGAQRNGLTVQYCMPYMRFLVQSAEVEAVTQARASDDYNVYGPDRESNVQNWQIGGQSLLLDALGLAPSKDGFWSTTWQPGNPYGDAFGEFFPRLQAAVATLSAGPVQVGDGIGFTNRTLVMRSCRKDGRLLQPSSPATLIDAMLYYGAFGGTGLPLGQVWFAPAFLAQRTYGYLFVANLSSDWSVVPSDLPFLQDDVNIDDATYWAYESNTTATLVPFSKQHPLLLKRCYLGDFQLWSILVIENSGWAVQGEIDKWVGVSEARVTGIDSTDTSLQVRVMGAPEEDIRFAFVNPSGQQLITSCRFDETGTLTIGPNGQCDP